METSKWQSTKTEKERNLLFKRDESPGEETVWPIPYGINSSSTSLSNNSGVVVPSAPSVYHPWPAVIFYFLDLFLPSFSKHHLLYPFLLSLDSSFFLPINLLVFFLRWYLFLALMWVYVYFPSLLLSKLHIIRFNVQSMIVVQSLSCIQLFVTPWTAALQTSLSFTISWSLLKLMSIQAMMPSNHHILFFPFSSCLQSFPASGSFPMSWLFASGGQNVEASASVLPMNIHGWLLLGLTGLVS